MTVAASLYHQYKRYRTLRTGQIKTLPIVILMPHSACNCQCVMCDIWKDNKNLKQLTEEDIRSLLVSLKSLGTQQVLMSGGEAMLNPNFFRFCKLLRGHGIRVSVLSTGLTLKRNAEQILEHVSDIIVSLDGDQELHDRIRNIPNAFGKLAEGVAAIKSINPAYRITARTVIHRLNFRRWPAIIDAAREMGLDQISFLPADTSSHAFNREVLWSEDRQHEIIPAEEELEDLKMVLETVINQNRNDRFIAESPEKLWKIYEHYTAAYGYNLFPYKKCNAPWVSTVVEADGTVRPCFFHPAIGNIREQSLEKILNSEKALRFRKDLDMESNSTCVKCVCYLHLSPRTKLV